MAAQTATAAQPVLRAGTDGLIHPIAWAALFGSPEEDALEGEFLADESVEVVVFDDEVAAERGRAERGRALPVAEFAKNVGGEKGDLAFEAGLVVEEAITAEAATGHAFDAVEAEDGVGFRFEAVTADEVVS